MRNKNCRSLMRSMTFHWLFQPPLTVTRICIKEVYTLLIKYKVRFFVTPGFDKLKALLPYWALK